MYWIFLLFSVFLLLILFRFCIYLVMSSEKNDHIIPISICKILSALAGIFENNASEYDGNLYLFLALLQKPLLFPHLGADFWVKPCMFYHVKKVSINSSFVGVKFFQMFSCVHEDNHKGVCLNSISKMVGFCLQIF